MKIVSTNRKAKFEYFLLDQFEAGISLKGSEIKSIRAGQISIKEAYIRVDEHEAWLMEAHVAPYAEANRYNHEPRRPRQLLLHKREIRKLRDSIRKKGLTIIPTKVYLKGGRAKVEIALARGKKLHDKRHAIKEKESERDMKRQMQNREY
ncbi:MAG: SsrA-binding protein SmpB [Anaerolineae bacterium]|nr:SsrA-binding protein SmpB [Anaerolineae bacterium]MBT3712787.1 SsrA-binding protein SmpB [Anaerolineae bacterium]MBT4311721.1 SsrA-binding protein SmpB [Anaerolineae bacterium]MBT4459130.1 SsrA-binding protein SmpB [Anaerolineae bacterium]MBT4840907.1 SsrA-binding protein SmpB [Anaerolineae bacterium]